MCGGVALYLVGLAAFRLRILGELSYGRLLVALALIVLFAVGGGLPAWAIGAGIALLVGALCVGEVLVAPSGDGTAVTPVSRGAEPAG